MSAQYPSTIAQCEGSVEQWDDPLLLSISLANTARGRRLAPSKKRRIKVKHMYLTGAQVATIEAFYDANRNTNFQLSWQGMNPQVIYNVMFIDSGVTVTPDRALTYTIEFSVREV